MFGLAIKPLKKKKDLLPKGVLKAYNCTMTETDGGFYLGCLTAKELITQYLKGNSQQY